MQLNLPHYDFRLRRDDRGTAIFDRLRKRYVALTPEEWVRQHFVEWLIRERAFPQELMANEVTLTLNGVTRRCDTLVADRAGQPLVMAEYKAPTVKVSQHTFDQIVRYNSVLRARILIVSNGINHYCCQINPDNGSYAFLPDIPNYNSICQIT